MEIKIIEKVNNPLLNRIEIKFECEYPQEATPTILDVKHKLIALEDSSNELLVVEKVKPSFGVPTAVGSARVYDSVESLNKIETKAVKNKNEEPEVEEEPEEAAEAEAEVEE